MVGVIKLGPGGQSREGRTIVGEAEGGVGDMRATGGGLREVGSGAGFALDGCLGGVRAQRALVMLLLLLLLL